MKHEIELAGPNGLKVRKIDAYIYGDLGVHHMVAIDTGQRIGSRWAVTNIPSGMMVMSGLTKRECVAYAKAYNKYAKGTGAALECRTHKTSTAWLPNTAMLDAHAKAMIEAKDTPAAAEAMGRSLSDWLRAHPICKVARC